MADPIILNRKKRQNLGKWIVFALLSYGLAITVLYFFTGLKDQIQALTPFGIPVIQLSYWMNAALVYVPLALISMAAWFLIVFRKKFGREVIIVCMILYLGLTIFFHPLYMLLVTAGWHLEYFSGMFSLGLCGYLYPILVLIAMHIWNVRNI